MFSCQFEIPRKTIQKPLKITIWYEEHFGQIFQLKYFRRILKRIFVHRITSLFRLWYVYSPGNDQGLQSFFDFNESYCFFLRSPETNSRSIWLCWIVCSLRMYCFVWVAFAESVVKNYRGDVSLVAELCRTVSQLLFVKMVYVATLLFYISCTISCFFDKHRHNTSSIILKLEIHFIIIINIASENI